jgi:hypothetical protein
MKERWERRERKQMSRKTKRVNNRKALMQIANGYNKRIRKLRHISSLASSLH